MNLKIVILCLQYFGSLFTGKKYPLKPASIIKENEVKLEIDTGEFILHYFTLKRVEEALYEVSLVKATRNQL